MTKIAERMQEKYGKWTGKTLAKGKGQYTYVSWDTIHDAMRELGYFQTEWYQIPPYKFPKEE